MVNALVVADSSVEYSTKESPVIVAAAAFVIAVGGLAVASIAICGWRGSKQVMVDWMHGKATFVCR